MIDWRAIECRLAALAAAAAPGRLLSLSLPLARLPAGTPWPADDGFVWQRADRALALYGSGRAMAATSGGPGRFAALDAAQRGLAAGWLHDAQGAPPPIACIGFAFAPTGGAPLPNARLWVPELLLRIEDGQAWLTLSCAAAQAAPTAQAAHVLSAWQARWRSLWEREPASVSPAPTFYPRPFCPHPLADEAFLARGRAALAAIAAGTFDKLVLTRSARLVGDGPIAGPALVATLAAHHPACAVYAVTQAGATFVGASPETLLAVQGERVAVDALAGTAWREAALTLDADKNRREHDVVAEAVAAALGSLCAEVAVPAAPEVMQLNDLNGLRHLRRRVLARRPAAVSIFDLVARLFPTPAVGGAPAAAAGDWLAAHGDRRGAWYTGGIGWIDAAGDADLAVALRCGLVEQNTATLYAGAGFVAGSDPEQELAETAAKFSAMQEALGAATTLERRAA